jgi:beta-phosphoglucomutase-like phosphatase (HAD superfamily)
MAICKAAPLEAVLFDIDGTMCVSDPFHHRAFSELLVGLGYNGGVPITREFGMEHMAGRSNEQIGRFLFPGWEQGRLDAFFRDKEALFARYAREGLEEIAGLTGLCRWAQERGIKRAAVTNAPRANAELMTGILGLSDLFQLIVTGEDCDRSKPSPDPYLRALALLGASPDHTVVFEDSTIGVQAGVAAGMPVVAIADERRESKLLAVGATFVIRDYQDPKLWAALDKIETKAGAPAEVNGVLQN